jgi:hypothetical protein
MPDTNVPDLIGLTQSEAEAKLKSAGLAVGAVTKVNSATAPAGCVTNATPASGTPVSPGSAVKLEVSSGQVAVPNVVGLTQSAGEAKLKSVGLVAGAVKMHRSDVFPADGISRTDPKADTLVSPATEIALDLSSGPKIGSFQKILEIFPIVLFACLGFGVVALIAYIIVYPTGQTFLEKLANKEVARGLITFLIALSTVGIAIILAISTVVLTEGPDGDKRFDRGKQVLSVLIGVLGTIVGFYFGSAPDSAKPAQARITTSALPEGAINKPYLPTSLQATGLTPPLKWSVTPALPSGLTLDNATGTINGTPTAVLPPTQFKFTVTDSATSSSTDLKLEIK